MDDSPLVEIVPKKIDWKEVGGGDRDKWKELVPRALPNQSRKYRANSYPEQDGRILKGR